MKVFVVVNRIEEIGYRQTTAMLIASLARKGIEVYVSDIEKFSLVADERTRIQLKASCFESARSSHDVEALSRSQSSELKTYGLSSGDTIMIRTNPGRDIERSAKHRAFLDFCNVCEMSGMRLVNDPKHLELFASKASIALLAPKYRPTTIVSSIEQQLLAFVASAKCDCVLKPAIGSRGNDVIRLSPDDPHLESKVNELAVGRLLVAQHFVHADHEGDKRVIVLAGEVLEHNNTVAGIHRTPKHGDFRANLHAGGTAHPLNLNQQERETANHAASLLMNHGIELAGVDLIGGKVIEFNVFSTGGLFDCVGFSDIPFEDLIVDSFFESPSQEVS